jgi:hypothetical protein
MSPYRQLGHRIVGCVLLRRRTSTQLATAPPGWEAPREHTKYEAGRHHKPVLTSDTSGGTSSWITLGRPLNTHGMNRRVSLLALSLLPSGCWVFSNLLDTHLQIRPEPSRKAIDALEQLLGRRVRDIPRCHNVRDVPRGRSDGDLASDLVSRLRQPGVGRQEGTADEGPIILRPPPKSPPHYSQRGGPPGASALLKPSRAVVRALVAEGLREPPPTGGISSPSISAFASTMA